MKPLCFKRRDINNKITDSKSQDLHKNLNTRTYKKKSQENIL